MPKVQKRTISDSKAQRDVENKVLDIMAATLHLTARPEPRCFRPRDGVRFEIDAFSDTADLIVAAEIFAHIGKLKAAQKAKVAKDILKLVLLKEWAKDKPDWKTKTVKLYIVFVDPEAAAFLTSPNTWVGFAGKELGIEPLIIGLATLEITLLQEAQRKQNLLYVSKDI